MVNMKKVSLRLPVLLFLMLVCASVNASLFSAKVIGVHDGDTITVLHSGKPERIRLHGIDAPELSQDFGRQAKKACSDLCFGKVVSIETTAKDRYGRTVAVVTAPGGINVNQELVKRGYAWWYREYAPNSKELPKLEEAARKAKLGLWTQGNPVPPSEFRRTEYQQKHPAPEVISPSVSAQASQSKSDTVYITKTGACYHTSGCRTMKRVAGTLTRTEAERRGYRACKVCKP